jgi:hypothetical protein
MFPRVMVVIATIAFILFIIATTVTTSIIIVCIIIITIIEKKITNIMSCEKLTRLMLEELTDEYFWKPFYPSLLPFSPFFSLSSSPFSVSSPTHLHVVPVQSSVEFDSS